VYLFVTSHGSYFFFFWGGVADENKKGAHHMTTHNQQPQQPSLLHLITTTAAVITLHHAMSTECCHTCPTPPLLPTAWARGREGAFARGPELPRVAKSRPSSG